MDCMYSISNIQDYFEYILKKHGENIDKPSVKIYVNKIENRITFKIKNGYSLEVVLVHFNIAINDHQQDLRV